MGKKITADLCDIFGESVSVAAPVFHDFGGRHAFDGLVTTVKVFEDNSLVRSALEEPGMGRVLVVDGDGSLRCALVGDQLALRASRNGWSGIVIYGCIRDTVAIAEIALGVKALATSPRRSAKMGKGERDVEVRCAEILIKPGDYLYADEDGVVVAGFPIV